MTRHIIRFLEEPDRTQSIVDLLGRADAIESLRALPSAERPDALVREYCKSLHTLANFEYVSSAAIFDPDKDEIRYYLVYGTNHHRGIEVFKSAEATAARLQDTIRHEASKRKAGGQDDMFGQMFGEGVPTSKFAFHQWEKYCEKAKRKVVERLLASPTGVAYTKLFCDAMAFPLVTTQVLQGWLEQWEKAKWIEFRLDEPSRKKPSPDHKDFIVVLAPDKLRRSIS